MKPFEIKLWSMTTFPHSFSSEEKSLVLVKCTYNPVSIGFNQIYNPVSIHGFHWLNTGRDLKGLWSNFLLAAAAKSRQSCPTLCNPIDGSPPGSPVPGILQARTLEWVAISFSNESEKWKWSCSVVPLVCYIYWWWWWVTQLCPNLCDPMNLSPPSSSAHGIFQARVFPTQGSNLCHRWNLYCWATGEATHTHTDIHIYTHTHSGILLSCKNYWNSAILAT